MSWDLFVQDIPSAAKRVDEIPDDFKPAPLGHRSEVIRRILEVAPATKFGDASWGMLETHGFSVEFNLGEEENVLSFTMHIRGGDVAAGFAAALLGHAGWRAFDPTSYTGIFDPRRAEVGLAKWRAFRARVVDDSVSSSE